MPIYLMQHGESKSKEDEPERPLTEAGRATVERVAARAASLGLQFGQLYHSGILRARQTAEILARHLGAEDRVASRAGLEPLDPVEPVARWLLEATASGDDPAIALVGHLPFLDRLASRLVAGDEAAQAVAFQMGGLVKLVAKQERAGFAVAWLLAPELVAE
jgi:phosphohistidine phosphatase